MVTVEDRLARCDVCHLRTWSKKKTNYFWKETGTKEKVSGNESDKLQTRS